MALTLGFTSMDKATETALRATFAEANEQLQDRFTLVADSAAEYVIIDMDSMYGPMGWLRLHAAGKQVIGLTSAARTQADFRIGRPFDTEAMVEMLRQVAASAGVDLGAESVTSTTAADDATPSAALAEEADAPAAAAGEASNDAPAVAEAVEAPQPLGEPAAAEAGSSTPDAVEPAAEHPSVDQGEPAAVAEAAGHAAPEPETQPEPEPHAPPRDPVLADWLQPGELSGRLRFRRGDGPELWIDADARVYHGPQLLKPLAPCFEGTVTEADFERVDDEAWAAGSAAAGEAQPLSRLQWLGGLLAGKGELLPGNDPEGRYRLTRWPQTEREYPRHFRIATAMMKGPATLAEIAEASNSPLADVADFTNANLATGFAEFVPEPRPEPEAPPKAAGFFSRLRGRT